jgi:hypothetical protein
MSSAAAPRTLLAAAVFLAVRTVSAVGVKVDADKTFDFGAVRTWAWHPEGPGDVKMARTADDDPDAVRREAEPILLAAVEQEMTRRGRQRAAGAPDVFVIYYLLLSLDVNAQTLGQFVPATPEWGLPPFTPSTTSFEVMNQGSLVLDVSANKKVVWRGVANARIRIGADRAKREALLREAVRDLLRKFPKRS